LTVEATRSVWAVSGTTEDTPPAAMMVPPNSAGPIAPWNIEALSVTPPSTRPLIEPRALRFEIAVLIAVIEPLIVVIWPLIVTIEAVFVVTEP
jgi:hypothetical protein